MEYFLIISLIIVLIFAYKSKTCKRCKKFIWAFEVISVDYSKAIQKLKCPKCNNEFEKEIKPEISAGH